MGFSSHATRHAERYRVRSRNGARSPLHGEEEVPMDQPHDNALFVLTVVVLVLAGGRAVFRSFVIVRGNELGVLERRWLGRRLSNGHVVALDREVGIQAHVLSP